MADWVRLTPSLGRSYPCSLGGLPLDHGKTNAAARQFHGVSRLAVFIGAWALLWAEPASCRSHGHHVHARGLAKRHYSSGERLAHHRGHGRRTSAKSYAASALARGEDEAPLNASDEVRLTRHRDAKGLAGAARGMLAQQNDRVIQSLDKVAVPTLVLVGANDTNFLAATDYMAAKIKGAAKAVIPDAGHAANLHQPALFNQAVEAFLAKLPAS